VSVTADRVEATTDSLDLGQRLRAVGRSRVALIWIGLALAAIAGYQTVRSVDLERLPLLVAQLRPEPLVLAVALMPLAILIKAAQWQAVCLPAGSARLRDLYRATGLGLAVNNLAPARLGDVVRLTLGARSAGLGLARATSSMVVERLLDLLGLALLGLALLPFTPLPWQLRGVILTVGLGSALGLALLCSLASWRTRLGDWLEQLMSRWPGLARAGRLNRFDELVTCLAGFERPSCLVGPLLLSLLHWLVNGCIYGLLLLALGLQLPLVAPLFVMVVACLGQMLPSSPGYVGVLDYLCVLALGFFGVDPTAALAFALLLHAHSLLTPLAVGGLLLGPTLWNRPNLPRSVGEARPFSS
jgi:glycosyltransferase 2 family protein